MILSSGSSSRNASGLIKMIQEPSKIVLDAASLRFEKTKMLVENGTASGFTLCNRR